MSSSPEVQPDITWSEGRIRFVAQGPVYLLTELHGLYLGRDGAPVGSSHVKGPAVVIEGSRIYEGDSLVPRSSSLEGTCLTNRYALGDTGCELACVWTYDPASGLLARRDRLTNRGAAPFVVRRFLARLCLAQDRYEAYLQSGRWAGECQGAWIPLHAGSLVLGCEGGRTTQYANPYLAVRPVDGRTGLSVHLVPCGNWTLKLQARPFTNGNAFCLLEGGMADDVLHYALAPGESLEGPELLFGPLVEGLPRLSAAHLHRHALAHYFPGAKMRAPVMYNTWLDLFDYLDVERLRRALPVLRELGVEVFEVDAGWYGKGGINEWHGSVGDWTENQERSFCGRMQDFAAEVRAAGMKFGLFMEPETVGPDAAVRQAHPDWFVGQGSRLDLARPEVYAHIKSEIVRLITTYQLAWIRLDLNSHLGSDEGGSELRTYFTHLYRLFDEIRAQFPDLFVEQCASGGMRHDLNTASRGDGFYLSDTQNPVDLIRVSEGLLLRTLPGRGTRMVALRALGNTFPGHPVDPENMPETLVTTPAVGWQPAQYPESYDLDFVAVGAMMGVMGISGDPSSFNARHRERLKAHIAHHKRLQPLVMGATAHLLTEPKPIGDRSGWSAFQYHAQDGQQLVFAFRLQDVGSRRRLTLHELDPQAQYDLTVYPGENQTPLRRYTGAELMRLGLEVLLDKPASAVICQLTPVTH